MKMKVSSRVRSDPTTEKVMMGIGSAKNTRRVSRLMCLIFKFFQIPWFYYGNFRNASHNAAVCFVLPPIYSLKALNRHAV